MAKKFYVVWQGRETGIFTDWPTAQRSVDKFPNARFKSFPTRAEAEAAFSQGAAAAPKRTSPGRSSTPATKPRSTASTPSAAESEFQMQIYCDGACEPNPGEAGSGMAVYRDGKVEQLWYGLYNPQGTNNSAELNALYQSLCVAEQGIRQGLSVQVLCDSTYAINCISKWAAGWQRKDWTKSGGEIKNLEIIKQAFALYSEIADRFTLSHVKAHVGTEGNELADRMSIVAVETKEKAFVRYQEPYDIQYLLSLRQG
ncbi:ribonuclease H family protein [Marinobacterium jannaschii]|uniref:ribonuclease H family protein n=1 Tax=Marinobacterium jannaschii TaxID=64970 RepID=UPI0004882DF3|nr:ribonuclease H family protein [Marinobacterium jannaschii]